MAPPTERTVLITGATGALGSHVLARYQRAGQPIVALHHGAAPPQASGDVRWVRADVTDPASVREALRGLDVDQLVHTAGGFRFAHADQTSDADLDFLIDTNLKSAFYLVRALLPGMKERNYGRLVFVSSRATMAPGAGMAAYAASKAGLNALVASLAEETKKYDINVNAVLPTVIDTPANRRDMPKADHAQWVSPESLAEIVFSLTDARGKPVNGALLPVAGRL
jgi:NAD(P)-dependent dehydrogenase (short-subunit alcohol dehydrogenase family)